MLVCLLVCVYTTWNGAHAVQKRVLETLELEVEALVGYHVCVSAEPSLHPIFLVLNVVGEGIVMLPEASEKHSEEQNTNLIGFSIRGIKINEHKKVKFILQSIIKDQLHYAKLKYKSLECVSICSHVYMHVC